MAQEQATPSTHADDLANRRLSVLEAAQQVGVSEATVRGWISSGYLPAQHVNGRYWIEPADLAATQSRQHVGRVIPRWRVDPVRAGARLRELRLAAGLSQQDLSARSGLTHELISQLETGRRSPKARTVWSLARVLQVAPQEFVAPVKVTEETWSAEQTAAWLGVPTYRLYRWLKQGVLTGRKVSGDWRVPVAEVMALEASGRLRGRSRRLDPRFTD
jgi:excisionase family DNA binding protein